MPQCDASIPSSAAVTLHSKSYFGSAITAMAQLLVSLATEADLPSLVSVQLSVFGRDNQETRAKALESLLEDVRENSGLRIVKAELPRGNIVGFSMFFFPNTDSPTEQGAIPTPLMPPSESERSPQSIANRFFWLEGEDTALKAKAVDTFSRGEIQKHVRGRICANIQNMCVKPDYQNRSIGAAMMTWACERLDETQMDAYLEASGPGERLYKKFGFQIIGRSEKDFGGGLRTGYSHMWRVPSTQLTP